MLEIRNFNQLSEHTHTQWKACTTDSSSHTKEYQGWDNIKEILHSNIFKIKHIQI